MLSGRTPQISLRLCFFFSFLLPLHGVILRRHESGRGSTLAAEFDLTSSQIKDRACKEGSQGTFSFFPSPLLFLCAGDQTFSRCVTKESSLCWRNPCKPQRRRQPRRLRLKKTSKTNKRDTRKNPFGDFSSSFCARVKKVWLKEKKKQQQPRRCSTAATQMLKQTNSNLANYFAPIISSSLSPACAAPAFIS